MREIIEFNQIIDRVENRCMAVDGPVTPTLKEMTEDELSKVWHLLQAIKGEFLFKELQSFVSGQKYGVGYEFNIQLWAGGMNTIFINKDDVELHNVSEETPELALEKALEYLKRIKAKKP